MANFMATVNLMLPPHIVAIQLKIFHAGWNGDEHRGEREDRVSNRAHAHGEHVVRPHAESEETDEDTRVHHDRITKQRLAGERWQYF